MRSWSVIVIARHRKRAFGFGIHQNTRCDDVVGLIAAHVRARWADRDLEEVQPQWSPDGTRLAYAIRGGGRSQLVVQTLASGAETIVTPATASDAEPVWAPDGAWIAVVRAVGRESQLIAVPIAGGEPVRISKGAAQLPPWFASTR